MDRETMTGATSLAAGVLVTLSEFASASPFARLAGAIVIIAAVYEWIILRRRGEESARAANRMIVWVGFALLLASIW